MVSRALKLMPSSKLILLAVLAIKEPPISKEAFAPKIIPLGLIRNKLAWLLALIKPSIFDIELPVILLIILIVFEVLLK